MEIAVNRKNKFKSWVGLSRIPFHSVGIAPMLVGTVWANQIGVEINWLLAIIAIVAVVLTMLSTYLAGEYYDRKEDILSLKYGKSNFAGGSGEMSKNIVEHKNVLMTAQISAVLVTILGLFIFLFFKTGNWTLPLGAIGLFAGYCYSTPPVRLVKRKGLGEFFIAVCYGWLPVFVASYLQTGILDERLLLISTPIAISIFLVIFDNEYPDYFSDKETNKTNLMVSVGRETGSIIYLVFKLLNIGILYLIMSKEIFQYGSWLILPMAISLITGVVIALRLYDNKKILEAVCGMTIIENLSICLIYIVSLW